MTTPTLTTAHLGALRKAYAGLQTIDPCQQGYRDLCALLDGQPDAMLATIAKADIKFVSLLARNRCNRRGVAL